VQLQSFPPWKLLPPAIGDAKSCSCSFSFDPLFDNYPLFEMGDAILTMLLSTCCLPKSMQPPSQTTATHLWKWARRARCAPPPGPRTGPRRSRAESWAGRLERAAPHTAPGTPTRSGPTRVGSGPRSRSSGSGTSRARGHGTPSISSAINRKEMEQILKLVSRQHGLSINLIKSGTIDGTHQK